MSIIIENLTHIYQPNTPFETVALKNINIVIEKGEFIGLIGHTGSGKSTLIQHLNGLLRPTSGRIIIDDLDITRKDIKMQEVRKKVGLVFQYPEHQLFEETVYKDVAFGPSNLGLTETEIESRVKRAIQLVGLSYEEVKDRSPFDLSGGQKRRIAIAGVLAMEPEVLILDEPTAGLDPKGRNEILSLIKKMHEKYKMTILLVSHNMEDIAKLADRIIVMHKGTVALTGTPREIFSESERLKEMGLGVPQVTELMKRLKALGNPVRANVLTTEEAKEEILKWIRGRVRC
ncbi:MAG TPA: energy-coupling factor transporter ATPase [Clostridiales bacterium]|nr:energy-coupling factor transporter ATPase [Clostridiales bacterium]